MPSGSAIASLVSSNAVPCAGMTPASALYRSYPAARALPLVGRCASSESHFTCRVSSSNVTVRAFCLHLLLDGLDRMPGPDISGCL